MPKKSTSKQQSLQRSGRIASAHGAAGGSHGSDDDTGFNDNASVISNVSSGSIMRVTNTDDCVNSGDDGGEEISQDAIFEEKLKEAMDLASQKSAAGRTQSLDAICRALCKKYIPDFVDDRRITFSDIIERAVKKGKSDEIAAACNLAVLLCLQLDSVDAIQEVFKNLKAIFLTLLHDASFAVTARGALASAIGSIAFLASDESESEAIMASLEKLFLSRSSAQSTTEIASLTTSALAAWSLLLTEMPYSRSLSYLENHMTSFETLLDSPDVDLRIAAGEAIIVMYENASEHDEEGAAIAAEMIIPKLQELAKDSHKYRSKKDRKEQKSNFRDYVKTVEDGEGFYEKMAINRREVLEIDTWSQKKQYDAMCKTLGSGMNLHLTENILLRDIFGLGPPVPSISDLAAPRQSKHDRLMANQLSSKIRTQTRGRHRDKRSAVV